MNIEKLMTFKELQAALAERLPTPPSRRTINLWLETVNPPMPSVRIPGGGKGTGKRTHRWFRLSDVLAWLEDPEGFYAKKNRAS